MAGLEAESVDAVCTDPPYEINFMGRSWDRMGVAFNTAAWEQMLRLLKPGGFLLSFAATRTAHRIACAIEDAGFQIRDTLMWIQGQGFPKNYNLLKPSFEPIILARKPLEGTIAHNVNTYGTGMLNIDACRIGESKSVPASPRRAPQNQTYGELGNDPGTGSGWDPNTGRWPSNVLLGHTPRCQFLYTKTVEGRTIRRPVEKMLPFGGGKGMEYETIEFPAEEIEVWDCAPECPAGELGEASRFFYQAKTSVAERHAGCLQPCVCGGVIEGAFGNTHPT